MSKENKDFCKDCSRNFQFSNCAGLLKVIPKIIPDDCIRIENKEIEILEEQKNNYWFDEWFI